MVTVAIIIHYGWHEASTETPRPVCIIALPQCAVEPCEPAIGLSLAAVTVVAAEANRNRVTP